MSLTRSRTVQYLGLILIFASLAGGYWYWQSQAAVTAKRASNTGLIGYWSFDEGTGTQAGDASGNGNGGTLTNGPTWVDGKRSKAINFDGTNDYVESLDAPFDLGTGNFTYSVWAKRGGTGIANFIGKWSGSSGPYMQFDTNNKLRMEVFSGSRVYFLSTDAITDTNWHHYVCMRTSTTNIDCYQDGVLLSGTDFASGTADADSTTNLIIGGISTNTGAEVPFNGSLDEVRIYNRVLSGTEITNLYNLGAAKVNTTENNSLTSGLVALWSFNGADVSGTTAYDRSGSGNNGTLTNGPTITPGISGQALDFDGSNDYVALPATGTYSSRGNMGYASVDNFTLSVWYKGTDTAQNGEFGKGLIAWNSPDIHAGFVLRNGYAEYDHHDYAGGGWKHNIKSSTLVADGAWHHLVYVNTNNLGYLYVDGVREVNALDSKVDSYLFGSSTYFQPYHVGANYNNQYTSGLIDEARIYNRALSASEIESLYRLGQPDKVNSSVSQSQGTGRLDSGLAGYWSLDDGSGTNANDASTNNNDGTLTNGPTWTTGQVGGATNFDGTDDHIAVSDAGPLNIRDSITLSMWVKYDTLPSAGNEVGLIRKVVTGDFLYRLGLFNNSGEYRLRFVPGGGGSFDYAIISVATGTWYHYSVTFHPSSGLYTLYVNGAVVGQGTDAGVTYGSGTGTLYIGSFTAANYLDGQMDEVRIYNRALSADEVAQLYRLNTPTGVDTNLKGYWSFNGQDLSGTTAYDRSGAGNNGTLTNSPTVTPGKLGQALSFDGANDLVSLGNTPIALRDLSLGDFSICSWINPNSMGEVGLGTIFDNYNNGSGGVDFLLRSYVEDTNTLQLSVDSGSGGTLAISNNNSITTNEWQYVCAVFQNSTGRGVLYRNGSALGLQDDIAGSSFPSGADADNPLIIGNLSTGTTRTFDGMIDEVRVYNRVLSAPEVAALYNQGR